MLRRARSTPAHPVIPETGSVGTATVALGDALAVAVGRRRRIQAPKAVALQAARFDKRADDALQHLRGRRLADRTFYAASELGDFSLIWHLTGAVRALRSDRHAAEALRLSCILAAESVLVNGVVKQAFRRTRPVWEQPRAYRIRRPRSSSFPSGHASAAFTAAAVLGEGNRAWPLYYGAAAIVATSRAYVRIHHATDVIAGVATGLLIGRAARRLWPKPVDGNPLSGYRHVFRLVAEEAEAAGPTPTATPVPAAATGGPGPEEYRAGGPPLGLS